MAKHRLPKGKVIALVVGTLLLITFIIGVIIPVSMSDGLERFEGDKQRVAQRALQEVYDWHRDRQATISSIGTYKYRVVAVIDDEVQEYATYKSCYKINVARVGLFGYVGHTGTDYFCIMPDGVIVNNY